MVTGTMIQVSMAMVDDTIWRAFSMLFSAKQTANLLRKPLPKPTSRLSIHNNTELMVNHTPFSYTPRHAKVSGTSNSCTTTDQPFTASDANTFFSNKAERGSLPEMRCMMFVIFIFSLTFYCICI